ncbi:MAG: GTPase ObgE [Desulfobulbaceae bacterium]|nr:GTPase ObgE [Desulfobulbaceae bacterium]
MAFIDEAKFFVKGGDGGRGCVSFRREKFVPKGGPDGGDGGRAGSVYLQASSRLHSLIDFSYKSHFIAGNGENGHAKKMHGKGAQDLIVFVPKGSIVKDADTGEVLADLVEDGDRFCAARGGDGGRGNVHFASAHNRAPRRATPGYPGEERWLRLELKLLADVGLIGLPNAGKSTLLSKLSAARPKIADYPFTTLEPQLGILQMEHSEPYVIADIPGLIHGAHLGVGLGHKFLRHIERTRVLLHVVDASCPDDEPWLNYQTIEEELRQYKDELKARRCVVVLNKIDYLESPATLAAISDLFTKNGLEVVAISALTGTGVDQLKTRLVEILDATPIDLGLAAMPEELSAVDETEES